MHILKAQALITSMNFCSWYYCYFYVIDEIKTNIISEYDLVRHYFYK